MTNSGRRVQIGLALLAMGLMHSAQAFNLTTNVNLNGGANLTGESTPGVPETITRQSGIYDWADKDGAGNPASDGLDFGEWFLKTDDGTSLTLDLNGGNIVGQSGKLALDTRRADDEAGSVTLYNVNTIDMGGINTVGGGNYKSAGNVKIGQPAGTGSGPAGNIRVDYIYANTSYSGYSHGGTITMYGSGDVKIESSSGTAGDLLTYAVRHWGTAYSAGNILIRHQGAFRAKNLIAYTGHTGHGGYVGLNGNYGGTNIAADHTCDIAVIHTYAQDKGDRGDRGGNISISNYAGVTIGTILSYSEETAQGGTVRIENIAGDISLTGTLNLSGADGAQNGDLILATTGAGISALDSLDLGKVGKVQMSAAEGWAAGSVTNALVSFDTSQNGGNGSWDAPYETTQTQMQTPEGQQIKYTYEAGGLNDYLGGHVYRVADLDGVAGQGGVLTPYFKPPPQGTVLILR